MPDDAEILATRPDASSFAAPAYPPGLGVVDNLLAEPRRKQIADFLNQGGWRFGWKSNAKTDNFSFWHKHFAGSFYTDHYDKNGQGRQYDCADELHRKVPLLHGLWLDLEKGPLAGHTLVRCYANGFPFGSEGSIHTDALSKQSFTSVYYPHDQWHPNWGGETVFFNRERTDIIASIYPRPNRLVMFEGTLPHVARGVSRICPMLRVTLMFKTEIGPLNP